jgi:hypothetical protein
MTPFFLSNDRQAQLFEEIDGWRETRFWRGAGRKAKKGVGADCVSFVEKVLVNLGAIKPIEWPDYVVYGGGEAMLSLLVKHLDSIPEFTKVWKPDDVADPAEITIVGDIWLRSVRVAESETDYHHLSIFVGGNTVVHMRERGLSRANTRDRFAVKQLQAIYRVYEQPSSESNNVGDRGGQRAGAAPGPAV